MNSSYSTRTSYSVLLDGLLFVWSSLATWFGHRVILCVLPILFVWSSLAARFVHRVLPILFVWSSLSGSRWYDSLQTRPYNSLLASVLVVRNWYASVMFFTRLHIGLVLLLRSRILGRTVRTLISR